MSKSRHPWAFITLFELCAGSATGDEHQYLLANYTVAGSLHSELDLCMWATGATTNASLFASRNFVIALCGAAI
jgi:hypothetical protein